ncbi:cell surface protein, partial [Brachyspira hyodysenteriae]
MKKFFLIMTVLLSMSYCSIFGMYGDQDDWIDFLTDGNQFRARMDQLGFVLGNSTIKGTFGFRSQSLSTQLG